MQQRGGSGTFVGHTSTTLGSFYKQAVKPTRKEPVSETKAAKFKPWSSPLPALSARQYL